MSSLVSGFLALPPWFFCGLFIVFSSVTHLLFKYSTLYGASALAFTLFAVGNVMGFFASSAETFALRGQNANIIFALCQGLGFCALQVVTYLLFREALSVYQVVGIVAIGIGVLLLSIR